MGIFDTMALILMKNRGAYLKYDHKAEEYVIVFSGRKKLIPVECKLQGNYIFDAISGKTICKIDCK